MGDEIAGATVARLVDAEIALAAGVDPATEEGIRTTFGALLQTTRNTGAIEAREARAINRAASKVASAAQPDGTPES